jgi:protoporphyrinogen oxidase
MLGKVLSAVPGLGRSGSGRFFYPQHGYGQISEAYANAATTAGADIRLNVRVESVIGEGGFKVGYAQDGEVKNVEADLVWSTIPLTRLAQCLRPNPPGAMLQAAERLDFRAMILIYLVVEQPQFSPFDAHYFPETHIPISRMSEPKNYAGRAEPTDLTVLCAELPCAAGDGYWQQSDADLGELVCQALASAGIPLKSPIRQVATRRLRQAYPIYRVGYEDAFAELDNWISQISGLLTFGRQGLFAHDNTHHALYMAYSAVACFDASGQFDRARWQQFRQVFETHVVED